MAKVEEMIYGYSKITTSCDAIVAFRPVVSC
jgi:hypothetical protein